MSKTNGEMQLESLRHEINTKYSWRDWSSDDWNEAWPSDGWSEWGDEIKNEVYGLWSDDCGNWPMNSWTKGKYNEIYPHDSRKDWSGNWPTDHQS